MVYCRRYQPGRTGTHFLGLAIDNRTVDRWIDVILWQWLMFPAFWPSGIFLMATVNDPQSAESVAVIALSITLNILLYSTVATLLWWGWVRRSAIGKGAAGLVVSGWLFFWLYLLF